MNGDTEKVNGTPVPSKKSPKKPQKRMGEEIEDSSKKQKTDGDELIDLDEISAEAQGEQESAEKEIEAEDAEHADQLLLSDEEVPAEVAAKVDADGSDSDVVELKSESDEENDFDECEAEESSYHEEELEGNDFENHEIVNLSDEEDTAEGYQPRPLIIPDYPHLHHCVLVLQLRQPFYIVGNYGVRVVKGTVGLMGAELRPGPEFHSVYSSRTYGVLALEIKGTKEVDSATLTKLESREFKCHPQDVVLILRGLQNSLAKHVQHYFPSVLGLNQQLVTAGKTTFGNLNFISCVGLYRKQKRVFKDYQLRLIEQDTDFLRTTVLDPSDIIKRGGIVLVCGGKGTGKSTVLRHLANLALTSKNRPSDKRVLYLDCDPGQSEFTLSGTVSLVEITKSFFGPAFSHCMKTVKSFFLGHLSVVYCPDDYLNAIRKLLAFMERGDEYKGAIVFVNTMGWTRGMGIDLLVEIIRAVKPTVVAQLASMNTTHNLPGMQNDFVWKHDTGFPLPDTSEVPKKFTLVHLASQAESESNVRSLEGIRAPVSRELMSLAYFSQLQPGIAKPEPLNAVAPYRVPWKAVAIKSCHTSLPMREILNLVVGNLVALCTVPKERLLLPIDTSHPRSVKSSTLPSCLGFGFVRAVDPTEKCFYVITPLLPKTLKSVNCFCVGVLSMPSCIMDDAPHFFAVSPGEILSPNRSESVHSTLNRGVVPRTFRKRR
ncbi:unnamed protein product [Notodromas monacha]|uniref:Polynucleotide 5'-hydroxyl-kinase NOL9 n=1 Tax=Notodromas monacha TaxID=399045 RepID=A0A7R9BGA2_9CRUS|nr:unnamed protein product [Notodromas monacha]CAG0913328.1 unnamed protein product [Notodromas monacha]